MNDLSEQLLRAIMAIANLLFKIVLLAASVVIGIIVGIFKAK